MNFVIQNSRTGEIVEVKATREGKGWRALCPFHSDSRPSLYLYPDNSFHCFGCGAKGKIVDSENYSSCSNYKRLTLKEFSLAKGLPLDFLEDNYVRDADVGVSFLYLPEDIDGARAQIRYRHSLEGPNRFTWEKGTTPIPYGLWKLRDYDREEPLFIVEGESDTLTLWYCGFQALGVPGVNTWKSSWSRYIKDFEKIFVVVEPDTNFALHRAISKSIRCIPLDFSATDFKDPSEAYINLGFEKFIQFMHQLVNEAVDAQVKLLPVKALPTKEVDWAIRGLFAKGVINLIAGEPGIGKTTLILNLIALASTGDGILPIGNNKVTIPACKSLYISLEDDLSSRVKPILTQLGVGESENIYLAYAESLRDIKYILTEAEKENFDIIVVDPLTNLLTDDINRIDKAFNLLRPFKVFARRHNVSIVVVWHLNKNKDVLGSVGFKSIAKTVILLGKWEGSTIVTQSKNAFCCPFPSVRISIGEGIVNWIGYSDVDVGEIQNERDSLIRSFLLSLAEEKKEWSFQEIIERAKAENLRVDSISVVAQRLVKKGLLKKKKLQDKNGRFTSSLWIFHPFTHHHINSERSVNMDETIENTEFEPYEQSVKNILSEQNDVKNPLFFKELQEQEKFSSKKIKSVNMDETIENTEFEPYEQSRSVNMVKCDNRPIMETTEDGGKFAHYSYYYDAPNWGDGDGDEEGEIRGMKIKGVIGSSYVEELIRTKYRDQIPEKAPNLDRFLSFLRYQAQKHQERLGILPPDEPFEMTWAFDEEEGKL